MKVVKIKYLFLYSIPLYAWQSQTIKEMKKTNKSDTSVNSNDSWMQRAGDAGYTTIVKQACGLRAWNNESEMYAT